MTLIYSGPNKHMFGGVLVETCLFIILLYVPGINGAFGGRPLQFFMLGIPGLGFSMLLLIWEETRKRLMNWEYHDDGRPNWFQRTLLWWYESGKQSIYILHLVIIFHVFYLLWFIKSKLMRAKIIILLIFWSLRAVLRFLSAPSKSSQSYSLSLERI